VRKRCKDVVHTKKDTALAPLTQREHFQMLVAELGGNLKLAMAALPRIDRRCRDPAGPPAPARPDHPGERGVTKFCTLTERTQYGTSLSIRRVLASGW